MRDSLFDNETTIRLMLLAKSNASDPFTEFNDVFDKNIIKGEFDYFKQSYEEDPNAYDESLHNLMLNDSLTRSKCAAKIYETVHRLFGPQYRRPPEILYTKCLRDQVDEFITAHPEHIETIYKAGESLWCYINYPTFHRPNEVINYIRTHDIHERVLIDYFSEYDLEIWEAFIC